MGRFQPQRAKLDWSCTPSRNTGFAPTDFSFYRIQTGRRLSCCVLRGGSWNNKTDWLRSSARNRNNTDNRNNNVGFRVYRAASPPLFARVCLLTVSRSVR
ncbi:SUMF1/EgtB/PvdO family nonheme iron enzyme [endosymbiont of Lamellibrachia barhami]|uniref:SUMF1/EgtB/PvdO family nonheme iron enzyme n=1 Tax=endosymbiont of Lamellibrachia barhami TaxID=205975 RepID=UPI0034E1E573